MASYKKSSRQQYAVKRRKILSKVEAKIKKARSKTKAAPMMPLPKHLKRWLNLNQLLRH